MADEKSAYATAGPPGYPTSPQQPYGQAFSPAPQQGVPQPGYAPAPSPYGVPQPGVGTPQFQQPIYSPQATVVVGTPMMMGGRVQNLSQFAAPCLCPNCGQTQVTRINYQSGSQTHLWAIILGVLACCCCIPYLIDGLKDVHHSCGNCGIPLAVWHRSGGLEVLAHQGGPAVGTPSAAIPLQPQQTGAPIQPQFTGAAPVQPQYTGAAPVQPQYTGAAPVQPQYTGSPAPGQFVAQGAQPTYNGPTHP